MFRLSVTGICYALIQLPNNQFAAGSGPNITIWSPLTNVVAPLRTLTGHAYTSFVYGLALSPDGLILASGAGDYMVKLWTYSSQSNALKTLSGHGSNVKAVCFVSNQILASGSDDKSIRIWDVSSGS